MNNLDTEDTKDGNKLPEYYDDPVDLFYKKYIKIINPYFYKLGFTPNFITTLSLFFGLLTCYLYYKQYYILSGIFYIISYFFDVMDGYYARLYDMKSKFGSYYDIISDLLIIIILFILLVSNKNIKKYKINVKLFIIILLVIFSIISSYNMSCQEKYVKMHKNKYLSEALTSFSLQCKDFRIMKYTKYFGTGIGALLISLIIMSHIFFYKKKIKL